MTTPAIAEALAALVAADGANYTRHAMAYEGLFDRARAALAEAGYPVPADPPTARPAPGIYAAASLLLRTVNDTLRHGLHPGQAEALEECAGLVRDALAAEDDDPITTPRPGGAQAMTTDRLTYEFTVILETERPATPEQQAALERLVGLFGARLTTLATGGAYQNDDPVLMSLTEAMNRVLEVDRDTGPICDVLVGNPENLPTEYSGLDDDDVETWLSENTDNDLRAPWE